MPHAVYIVAQWFVLFIFCVWIVECFRWAKVISRLKRMNDYSRRAMAVMRLARASDHWKQAAMMGLSGRIMLASLSLGLVWLVAFLPLLLWWALRDPLSVLQLALTWYGLLAATVMAGLYLRVRSRYAG